MPWKTILFTALVELTKILVWYFIDKHESCIDLRESFKNRK